MSRLKTVFWPLITCDVTQFDVGNRRRSGLKKMLYCSITVVFPDLCIRKVIM